MFGRAKWIIYTPVIPAKMSCHVTVCSKAIQSIFKLSSIIWFSGRCPAGSFCGLTTRLERSLMLAWLDWIRVVLCLVFLFWNKLRSFWWYFLMFTNSWIYWKVELLQHVNMKHNNKFYWFVKSFHLTIYWQVIVLYFNPTIFHNL